MKDLCVSHGRCRHEEGRPREVTAPDGFGRFSLGRQPSIRPGANDTIGS